jgi:hypothetical protein
LEAQILDPNAQGSVSLPLGERHQNRFPSVRLHPPPLAREFIASYGEMSRQSGAAAKEDNHSDISPFKWNQQFARGPKQCNAKASFNS